MLVLRHQTTVSYPFNPITFPFPGDPSSTCPANYAAWQYCTLDEAVMRYNATEYSPFHSCVQKHRPTCKYMNQTFATSNPVYKIAASGTCRTYCESRRLTDHNAIAVAGSVGKGGSGKCGRAARKVACAVGEESLLIDVEAYENALNG